MLTTRLNLTHALPPLLLLLVCGCSASHQIDAVGAAGEAACVSHWLAFDYGTSVFAYRNTEDGPGEGVEIAISDPGGGDQRFSVVTTLDVDGDGLRDVVVRDAYGGAAVLEERVSLTIIAGSDAPFDARERVRFVGDADIAAGGGISALGDWDGDGRADLGAQFAGGVIVTGEPMREIDERCARGVGVGDVDGDGSSDTVCDTGGAGVVVRLGGAASPETMEVTFDRPANTMRPAGDLNGDGRPEVFVNVAGDWFAIDLAAGARLELPDAMRSLRPVGDVDGDGVDDFIARRGSEYHLWRGGDGGPVEDPDPFSVVGDGGRSVSAAGDASCDGHADVIIRDHRAGEALDRISLHLGSEAGIASTPAWSADVRDGALVPVFD